MKYHKDTIKQQKENCAADDFLLNYLDEFTGDKFEPNYEKSMR
jgi:hypothetical protein